MDRISCAAEFKFADESKGEFEGYASVFGGLDSYGDQIAPGAFARTLAARSAAGGSLPMYMQHGRLLGADPRPVGVWDSVQEDGKGLKVSGHLVGLNTETGKYNLALVKEGAMRGLSIGFRAIKADYPKTAGGPRRILKDVNLGEISIVDDPADKAANITAIKSSTTIREFEEMLRNGTLPELSANEAKALLSGGFKALNAERDAGTGDELAEMIRRNISILKN